MKIIITGGNGFLGKRLIRELTNKNYIVFIYDLINNYDILNIGQLQKVFNDFKPNTIIHLAACAVLNIFAENPDLI